MKKLAALAVVASTLVAGSAMAASVIPANIQPTQACVGAAKIAYNAYYSIYPQMEKVGKGTKQYEALLTQLKSVYSSQWDVCLEVPAYQLDANQELWVNEVPHPLPSA